MRDASVLAPAFVLAAWTGLILVLVAARRMTAGVAPREYALGEPARLPPEVSLVNRNYMNLLEIPVLFYVICLVAYSAQAASPSILPLAWGYVGLRIVHSLIHITYNTVLHRFLAFVLSNVVLVALWVAVGLAVFSAGGAA
jgi:hypothetical protein